MGRGMTHDAASDVDATAVLVDAVETVVTRAIAPIIGRVRALESDRAADATAAADLAARIVALETSTAAELADAHARIVFLETMLTAVAEAT